MKAAVQEIHKAMAREIAVSTPMLETVLAPYKLHCRYLQSAIVERVNSNGSVVSAWGSFAISESCYITDTGHFNAVEFNICYNQLTYCLLAQSIQSNLLNEVAAWSLADFSRRQLSDFLIVQFSSTFRKPLSARKFEGRVDINRITNRRGSLFMKTSCSFEDPHGATSDGEALIVVLSDGNGNGKVHKLEPAAINGHKPEPAR